MPSTTAFVLEDELDELTYDFRTKDNRRAPHGTIAEPSADAIVKFQKDLRRAIKPARELLNKVDETVEGASDEEIAAEIVKAGDDANDVLASGQQAILEAVAALCSNHPSITNLKGLPYRAQQAFVGWIIGVFLNPSPSTPATKQ